MKTNKVEVEASEALLDIGVSIPLLQWKIPFKKKLISLRLTMRRPCFGNQIRIARKFLSMGAMKRWKPSQKMSSCNSLPGTARR